MGRLTLDEEQMADLQAMLNNDSGASLDASEMGTGKTLLACEFIIRVQAKRVLLVVPLNTLRGWRRTLLQQGFEHPITLVDSKNINEVDFHAVGAYLIGREFVHLATKGTKTREPMNWKKYHFDVVVYDEVQSIQNRKSRGAEVMQTIQGDYKHGMSGTPFGNKFDGAYSVTHWLWPSVAGNSYWRWRALWCEEESVYMRSGAGKPIERKVVVGEKTPGLYVSTLPLYLRRELDLSNGGTSEGIQRVKLEPLLVELTPAQRKIYDAMEEDYIAFLESGQPLTAALAITKRTRLREISLAVPSLTDDGQVVFAPNAKSAKIDALQEWMGDHEEPVMVYTHSRKFADLLSQRIDCSLIVGGQTQAARDREIENFLDGKTRAMVATIKAVGEGLDGLQNVSNHEIWLSVDDNGILNEQTSARLYRRGQRNHVYELHIMGEDTLDEGIVSKKNEERYRRALSLQKGLT